jgi:hypothetical protein
MANKKITKKKLMRILENIKVQILMIKKLKNERTMNLIIRGYQKKIMSKIKILMAKKTIRKKKE